jgi:hypothetical protein
MITASELAGFFAAHAVWSVADGSTLIPILAYNDANGERKMERLAHDDLGAAVEHGKQKLASNEMDATDAVLLYDGRFNLGQEKVDAVIIELRAYFAPEAKSIIGVPYTPRQSGEFRVHTPKLLAWSGCEDFDKNAAFESFFAGVNSHEKGAEVWQRCLDESK